MVLSHSCEVALANKLKLTSIILAPIRSIHKATRTDRIQELINSNLIDRNNPQASFKIISQTLDINFFFPVTNFSVPAAQLGLETDF